MNDENTQDPTKEEISSLVDQMEAKLEALKATKKVQAEGLFEYIKPKLDEYMGELTTIVDEVEADLNESIESVREDISNDDLVKRVDTLFEKIGTIAKIQKDLTALGNKMSEGKGQLMEYVDASSKLTREVAHRALGIANELNPQIPEIKSLIQKVNERIDGLPEPFNDEDIWKELKDLRKLILSRNTGGGNMNRNISVGGNSSVLSRYTDLNIKAGANVTLSYVNNNTTKNVDLTISATGGGGGGGLSRSINSVAVDTAAGFSSATDYVYLVSGTTTITMPDATAGNTNLYTIKNVGTGTVTVATQGGQTIDGSTTAVLPVRYTSIDLESDTANWNVT